MNKDLAKDYLSQITEQKKLIHRLENTVLHLRERMTSLSSGFSANKIRSSLKTDTTSDTIAKIVDLEKDIEKHIQKLTAYESIALQLITKLPEPIHQSVLIARYIEGKKWDTISIDLSYSIAHVYKLHNAALSEFVRINYQEITQDNRAN